jgi:hypothetical protein
LQRGQGKNAFRLVSDVEEHRLGIDSYYGGLELPAALGLAGVALLKLREDISERFGALNGRLGFGRL